MRGGRLVSEGFLSKLQKRGADLAAMRIEYRQKCRNILTPTELTEKDLGEARGTLSSKGI